MRLILWDNTQLPPHLTSKESELIRTATAWQRFYSIQKFQTIQEIHLLAELNWRKKSLTSFYGFDLIREIRTSQTTCPIHIYSVFPKNYLLDQEEDRFQILKLATSHPFHDLLNTHTPTKVASLSERQLNDMIYTFYNPKGMLSELAHTLKNKIEADASAVAVFFQKVAHLLPTAKTAELNGLQLQFQQDLTKQTYAKAKLVNQYKDQIIELMPKSLEDEVFTPNITNWQVLFVDDDLKHRDKIKDTFHGRNIPCHVVSNAQEAFHLLRQDHQGELLHAITQEKSPINSITVLICDIRLEHLNGNWQALQGYDIIHEVYHEFKNQLAFFVLTSKRGAIIRESAALKKIQIQWFAKEDVLNKLSNSGLNLFCNKVVEAGNRTYEALTHKPSTKYWTDIWKTKIDYPLVAYYRQHRLSSSYYEKERWINQCAQDFIEEAEYVKISRSKTTIDPLNFDFKFKASQTQSPSTKKGMDNFYIKLIGRRIALGLHLKGWAIEDISDILKDRSLGRNTIDKQLFSAYLALSIYLDREIPNRILIEEQQWVESYLGIQLYDTSTRQAYKLIRQLLEELKDELYQKGCGDDFVEDDFVFHDHEEVIKYIQQAKQFAQQYHVYDFEARLNDLKTKFTPHNKVLTQLLS